MAAAKKYVRERRLGWLLTAASLVIAVLARPAGAADPDWSILTPTSPPPRAIGGHARGCLGGAEPLPLDGLGYQVMRTSRNRFYAHPITIRFVRNLAEMLRAMGGEGLLVGDLAQPRGGPIQRGHRSHQTGLDVDIWFLRAPGYALSREERESMTAVSMVDLGGMDVDHATWMPDTVELLRAAASFAEVDRIFVHAAIKRELCLSVSGDRAWLANIRPWWGHDDHFHVGLHCPESDRECLDRQSPFPDGDGCDETLAWWFSDEAAEEWRKSQAMPPRMLTLDDLPPACRAILADDNASLGPTSDDY